MNSRQPWSDSDLDLIEAHRGVRLTLQQDSEALWNNFRRDVRYQIRKGREKGNIEISFIGESVRDFYSAFQQFSQQMGTPVFGENFIQSILEYIGQKCQIVTARYDTEPIAGLFNFIMRDKIFGLWSYAIGDSRNLRATHRLFWALIETGCKRGYTQFDMGRSPYPSGQYKFKAQWGDQDYPIYQLFRIYRGKEPSLLHVSTHQNNNMSLFNQIWRNLPSQIAEIIRSKIALAYSIWIEPHIRLRFIPTHLWITRIPLLPEVVGGAFPLIHLLLQFQLNFEISGVESLLFVIPMTCSKNSQ